VELMLEFLWVYGSLCVAAFAAGAVNAVAGGGTLLTFPTLLAVTPPPGVVANATSTAALVPGSLAGAWGYRRELEGSRHWLLLLTAPSLLGGVVGAVLMVAFPGCFNLVIPWLLLLASLLFLAQPYLTGWFPPHPETGRASLGVQAAVVVFQFFVAVYGGYFGAGIGILMLASLGLMGIGDINRMNAVKTILASWINGVSVIVFIARMEVEWRFALPMAVAAIAGGYSGASVGRLLPRSLVRLVVILVGLGLAAYFFAKQAGAIEQAAP
jgi:uncharacterized protein